MARMAECPGHFGHLEVAKPMFHIGFIKNVLSIMHRVRFNCSKILADEACWMVSASVSKGRSAMLCALECLMGTSSVFMWIVASSVERLTKKARTKHASGMERLSIRFWIGKVIHLDLAG